MVALHAAGSWTKFNENITAIKKILIQIFRFPPFFKSIVQMQFLVVIETVAFYREAHQFLIMFEFATISFIHSIAEP